MNEININFSLESPQKKDTIIEISIENELEQNLLYKFIMGCDGTWETLQDFSKGTTVQWIPKKDGKYLIMVQAKKEESAKPFDYVSRVDYIVGTVEEKLINEIHLNKTQLNVGEKLELRVDCNKEPVVYRYWIRENDNWQLIKDYSADNTLVWSVKNSGEEEIIVECKGLDSKNQFDDFKKINFEVSPISSPEITDFKCLSTEMFAGNEFIFQVEAAYADNRMILYKFIKINSNGKATCIQDYSSKRITSYVEKQSGEYKLLCMAKDMYSQNEYDDRALIHYTVKPYKEISIQSFTTDLSSPQICDSPIQLKAIVKGGKSVQYRFIIDGNYGEDSGYTRNNNYTWKPKMAGEYTLNLWVRDASFKGNYEAMASIPFTIDKSSKESVKINNIITDKQGKVIKNETVNIKVLATGGTELKYSFIVRKEGKEQERVEYGSCNWVNFTPEQSGIYEIEARVKDKYSRREYEAHTILHIEAVEYLPAHIDYVLLTAKENYLVEDTISFQVITQDTRNTSIRYVLKINGHKVEDSGYVSSKKYEFIPKCRGNYLIEVYARNSKSTVEFDCKRDVKIVVQDALPVTNTKIQCDVVKLKKNQPATFTVAHQGGKEVIYEFYLMENEEWTLVQKYSRKSFYTFMPFTKGEYRILVLCKSEYKDCAYEDYDLLEFEVVEAES